MFRSIFKPAFLEIEIKKSRFLAHACPIFTMEDALVFIEEMKEEHKRATHNCSAFIIGKQKEKQQYSDDGEPQGTAGLPMLDVLLKEDLTNICVVVTRYFGGIKLGASGLVRAYSNSCRKVIEEGELVYYNKFHHIRMRIDYTYLGKIEYFMNSLAYDEVQRDFSDQVVLEYFLPEDDYKKVEEQILEISQGKGELEKVGERDFPTDHRKRIKKGKLWQDIINGVK